MKAFDGRVAAITGAGSGIGRALALALVRRKAEVAISDVREDALAETAALCRAAGGVATATRVDVADRAAVHAWADAVVRDHGRVNLVFNNAGVALGCPVEHMTYEDLEWIVGINFWGVVHGTKAFLPHLRASGEGHVVNVSSVFGLLAMPANGAYNATKFAVRGYTEALRQELEMEGAPVSATCVHPGGIKTNIAKAARWRVGGGVDEAASRARFEALFITTPEVAAEAILEGVRRDARRVLVGPDARLLDLVVRLLPSAHQRLTMRVARRLSG